jgi:hypothetical protein
VHCQRRPGPAASSAQRRTMPNRAHILLNSTRLTRARHHLTSILRVAPATSGRPGRRDQRRRMHRRDLFCVFATGAGTHDVGYFGRRDFFSARRYVLEWGTLDASCERRFCRLGYVILLLRLVFYFAFERQSRAAQRAWALTQLSSHHSPAQGFTWNDYGAG